MTRVRSDRPRPKSVELDMSKPSTQPAPTPRRQRATPLAPRMDQAADIFPLPPGPDRRSWSERWLDDLSWEE